MKHSRGLKKLEGQGGTMSADADRETLTARLVPGTDWSAADVPSDNTSPTAAFFRAPPLVLEKPAVNLIQTTIPPNPISDNELFSAGTDVP